MAMIQRIPRRSAVGIGAAAVFALLMTGCAAPAPGGPDADAPAGGSGAAGLDLIPDALQEQYVGIEDYYNISPNPYAEWKAPKGPWQFCYNDSYAGNSWRKAGLDEAVKLNQQLVDAGVSKGDMIVTNADNDVNTQVSQLNNQVSQGCQVILAQPASPTGLCSAIDNAFNQGVLVLTIVAPATCPNVINTGFNDYKAGYDTASWLASQVGGGSVLLVNGIPGSAASEARTAGAKAAIADAGDVEVAGEVAGGWTPSTAKTEVLKFLATHPQDIGGVWQAGLMMPATGDAFEQVGRDLPKITGFVGECSELAYWKDMGLSSSGYNQGGAPAIYEAFYLANRMLAGAQPVANLVLYPLPKIDDDNLDSWYTSDMTVNSTCDSVPPGNRYVEDSYFDQLLVGGEAPEVTLVP